MWNSAMMSSAFELSPESNSKNLAFVLFCSQRFSFWVILGVLCLDFSCIQYYSIVSSLPAMTMPIDFLVPVAWAAQPAVFGLPL
jgi:hypothetical protein